MAQAYKSINRNGLQLRPFYSYKRWSLNDQNFRSDVYKVSVLRAISPDPNQHIPVSKSINGIISVDDVELKNSESGSTPSLANKFQKSVWGSLKSTFFYNDDELYKTASVFSIPHNRLGDGVKPNTFKGIDHSLTTNAYYVSTSFYDYKMNEYYGYIIDSDLDTSSYVGTSKLIGYWGFNDNVPNTNDGSVYKHKTVNNNISYSDGIVTTDTNVYNRQASGTKANFNGRTSHIRVNHNSKFNLFKSDEYAISLWTDLPSAQTVLKRDFNWIVSKSGTYTDHGLDMVLNNTVSNINDETSIYPFEIKVANEMSADDGKVFISISDGLGITELSSSTLINDGQHHVVFNKSATALELWIDGTLNARKLISLKETIANEHDIIFGSKLISDATIGDVSNLAPLTGSIDEVRIYKRALTGNQIKSLANNDFNSGSAYQRPQIGKIFYKNGIGVISDLRPKYKNIWLGASGSLEYNPELNDRATGFTTEYRSTKLLHETSVLCEIGADEFNVSTNPSLRPDNNINATQLKPFVTGSDFSTYITTIGLYNDYGDLLAIGKLAAPIKNRDDVDITVKVRFDLDGPYGTPKYTLQPEEKTVTLVETEVGKFVWNKTDVPDVNPNK
jgi:hypothetical protein